MNLQLDNAVEYIERVNKGTLGEILIRWVYKVVGKVTIGSQLD